MSACSGPGGRLVAGADRRVAGGGRIPVVGDNEPYRGGLPGDTIDRHATRRGLPDTLIEVRQDLIAASETARAQPEAGAHRAIPVSKRSAPRSHEQFSLRRGALPLDLGAHPRGEPPAKIL